VVVFQEANVLWMGSLLAQAWKEAVGEGATYPVDEVASNIAAQRITPDQE
jgi:hypothetical protein